MQDYLGQKLKINDKIYCWKNNNIVVEKITENNKNILLLKQSIRKTPNINKKLNIKSQYLPIYGPYSKDEIEYWVYNNYAYNHISQKMIINILHIDIKYLRAIKKKYSLRKSKGYNEAAMLWLIHNYHDTTLTTADLRKKFYMSKTQLGNTIRKLGLQVRTKERYEKAKKWMIENYETTPKTLKEISKELEVSSKTLGKYVIDFKLVKRKNKYDDFKEWMNKNYKTTKLNNTQISKMFEVGVSYVGNTAIKLNIKRDYDPFKNYDLEEWLLANFEDTTLTFTEIAKKFNVAQGSISYQVKKLNLKRNDELSEVEKWLIKNYSKTGLYLKEIGKLFNFSDATIRYYVRKHHLVKKDKYYYAKKWLKENYYKTNKSEKQIAKFLDISTATLLVYKKELKLKKQTNNSMIELTKWLTENYINTELTQSEIGDLFNVQVSTVTHYVAKCNLYKGSKNNIIKKWLEINYYSSSMKITEISELLHCSEAKLKENLSTLNYRVITVINDKPLELVPVDHLELANSFFNKNYPVLYNYLKHQYYGELSALEISRKYNIKLRYLENMMALLNVNDYSKYNLNLKQTKWIIQSFQSYKGNIQSIFKSNLFSEKDKKEFNRFINNH